MTPEDEKWLATRIVRCAERWPDRVGNGGLMGIGHPRCIMGEIGQVDRMGNWGTERAGVIYYNSPSNNPDLCRKAVMLNDAGVP